jgi:hypothetical protein
MGYYKTGLGAIPASLHRGAATSPAVATTGTAGTPLPNLIVRKDGVTTTLSPSQALAAGYIWVKTPAPGHWEKKAAAGGKTSTVTWTASGQSRCKEAGLWGVEADLCAAELAAGKGFEASVCKGAGVTGWLKLATCEAGLKNGKSLAEVLALTKTPAVVRDVRYNTLLNECAAAGVPQSQLEACVAARQAGASLEEAAGAAISAGKSRTLLIFGALGAAGLVGYLYWRKKKGKK